MSGHIAPSPPSLRGHIALTDDAANGYNEHARPNSAQGLPRWTTGFGYENGFGYGRGWWGDTKEYFRQMGAWFVPRDNVGSATVRFFAPDGFNLRHEIIAFIGEYLGTTMFLFLAEGGTNVALQGVNSIGGRRVADGSSDFDSSNLAYVALSFGAALAISVWCFFRVSGGLFNPAVTWAFMLIGAVTPLRGIVLFATQIMGGMSGAALARTLAPGKLHAATLLHAGVNHARGFFIEFFMTAILVFCILMMAVEKNRSTPIAPLGIGLTLFVCELFSVYWTGGALNPARAFGPCVVNHSFPGYHWIYWIGPLCGSILAVVVYWILKALRYTEVGGAVDHITFPGPDHQTHAEIERERTQLLGPQHHPQMSEHF